MNELFHKRIIEADLYFSLIRKYHDILDIFYDNFYKNGIKQEKFEYPYYTSTRFHIKGDMILEIHHSIQIMDILRSITDEKDKEKVFLINEEYGDIYIDCDALLDCAINRCNELILKNVAAKLKK